MLVADLYRVLSEHAEVVIRKDIAHGFRTLYSGKLVDCDKRYMDCSVKFLNVRTGFLIIKIDEKE